MPCGITEFSRADVERVFEPLDDMLDALVQRGVHCIHSTGVPLSVLMGPADHDAFLARISERTGRPAGTTLGAAVAAAKHLGIERIALVNKWDAEMNAALAAFFARDGIEVVGTATEVLPLSEFQGLPSADNMELAYALGRQAF